MNTSQGWLSRSARGHQARSNFASILLIRSFVAAARYNSSVGSAAAAANKVYAAATAVTAALLVYPASFPGAGAYHLLPLVPVLADLRYRLRPQSLDAALSPFLILFVGLLNTGQTSKLLIKKRADWSVAEEALALARESFPRTVQVGYGDNRRSYEQSQLSKTVLALNSYPAFIDAQILMELRQSRDRRLRAMDSLSYRMSDRPLATPQRRDTVRHYQLFL